MEAEGVCPVEAGVGGGASPSAASVSPQTALQPVASPGIASQQPSQPLLIPSFRPPPPHSHPSPWGTRAAIRSGVRGALRRHRAWLRPRPQRKSPNRSPRSRIRALRTCSAKVWHLWTRASSRRPLCQCPGLVTCSVCVPARTCRPSACGGCAMCARVSGGGPAKSPTSALPPIDCVCDLEAGSNRRACVAMLCFVCSSHRTFVTRCHQIVTRVLLC